MGLRDLVRPYLPKWVRSLRHIVYVVRNATYNIDGMMTTHLASFGEDPRFQEAYRLGKATGSWGLSEPRWRVYQACWAGRHGMQLEGDFVECGVNRGGTSRAVIHYTDFQNDADRKFYLLDTFAGFPDDQRSKAAKANRDEYQECFEEVRREFADFPNVILVRGKVPDTLQQVPSQRIAYLHIDMNVAEPEVAAIEFFWDRLVPGAIVLLDDYGFGYDYSPQKEAMDAFGERRGVEVLLLPTGQGLLVKP